MDVFAALEERVGKLISAHRALHDRVVELEEENGKLKAGTESASELTSRVAALEAERDEVRARLETLLANLANLEL
ncbi:MAG: cell division protein ZapB [Thermoanaerobaculales bacterium]|jgi:FtsZ-binding cell division protein ZapB